MSFQSLYWQNPLRMMEPAMSCFIALPIPAYQAGPLDVGTRC